MNSLKELKSGKLVGATHLQLVEELTTFPEEIFSLADTLEVLDLSNNNLSTLPDEFACLTRLKRVFLSFNQFKHIPEILAKCPALIMVAFKGCKITEFSDYCLPKKIEWLILTDNNITELPQSFGQFTQLKKLALAGNQIKQLPSSMAQCKNLELVRLSANNLTHVDDWLFELPKLTWLAFAGNDFNKPQCLTKCSLENKPLNDYTLSHVIGQGASGVIHLAKSADSAVAIKLFKGAITSDGYPLDEVNCCLQAGDHASLIKVLAYIEQSDQLGLVMELIDKSFANLGLPPSLETCTRDTFNNDCHYSTHAILKITKQMASTLHHLHTNKVSHGDIYAHNTMINQDHDVLFGDFGAATNLAMLSEYQQKQLELIEVRALGCLIEDLLGTVTGDDRQSELFDKMSDMAKRAMQPVLNQRPTFTELLEELNI
ncbi:MULTISPECIES: leucine-rich repeat-containing protein kinase family protein [unclassified Pseudoalteromonas]|uniref:leucine-rich repeat-containing protein kinase family protein n=1 Tax=unclassified Pseudoalteromonas TaxID=194690 RepID=UPI0018CD53F9|nr:MULTISPECIES: leucine-rich repeat-containing protein kinase family protein [unclassified Pseudoalteromonas]MBH0037856.1 protein kinase [Pseudoalteromonas sp. SWN166]MBH0050654.1 protein kinase [Pseudoalteromonas sp. SWYJZ19]